MISKEQRLLAVAQAEKEKLQYVTAKLEELSQQKALFERKIALITQLRAQQETAVRIMDAVSRRLPDWVWLTDLNFDGQLDRHPGRRALQQPDRRFHLQPPELREFRRRQPDLLRPEDRGGHPVHGVRVDRELQAAARRPSRPRPLPTRGRR